MYASLFGLVLLINSALCQLSPQMLAMMSSMGGAGGMGSLGGLAGLGLAGAEMGGSMQEMMLMQSLMNRGGSGGGGGGGGGIDPMMLALMNGGLGGAGGGGNDMMNMMLMMNLMNSGQNGGAADAGAGAGGNAGGNNAAADPVGLQNFATNFANMLLAGAKPSTDISPGQQNGLWGIVHMTGNFKRLQESIRMPTERIQLERDGLPHQRQMLVVSMCPAPTQCGFAFCENTEIPFTPESFYLCRGCPRCRLETGQQTLMNMMNAGGAGAMML